MTTALALPAAQVETRETPVLAKSTPVATQPIERLSRTSEAPGYVYGDSTPFEFDCNFIDILREAIDCCVSLMNGQQRVAETVLRASELERIRQLDRGRLLALAENVKHAITADVSQDHERAARAADKLLSSTRAMIEGELGALDAETRAGLAGAREDLAQARKEVESAFARFFARHDLPETRLSLQLALRQTNYTGEVRVSAPIGTEAAFEVAIPAGHLWSEPRRIRDVTPALSLAIKKTTKMFSKTEVLKDVRLDRMFLRGISVSSDRCLLVVGEELNSNVGYEIELDAKRETPRITVAPVNEEGVSGQPFELRGTERETVLELAYKLIDKTEDLLHRRTKLKRLTLDGKPLNEFEPQHPCSRLIEALAPTVREIARRSGAPGELVLRRNAGSGRREELFVTIAELKERIHTLPIAFRGVFAPLQLEPVPVALLSSPRDSVSGVYEEIQDVDFI